MIQIVDGVGVGSGKSYFVATRMFATVADGGTVYFSDSFEVKREAFAALLEKRHGVVMEQDQLREIKDDAVFRMHEVTQAGTADNPVLIVLDESQSAFNARDWADKSKRPFFDWLCQSRHDDNDLLIISQSANNIDKQIRRLATEVVRCRNVAKSRIPLLGGMPFFIQYILDQDGTNKLSSRWVFQDKGIFGIYETKSQRGKHSRLAGVIEKKQLQKTNKLTQPQMRLIIAIVLLAAGVLVWTFTKAKQPAILTASAQAPLAPPVVKTTVATQETVQTTARKDNPAPELRIVCEEFRGFVAQGRLHQLRTDNGWYMLGEISEHGLVTAVSADAAKIQAPDGGTVFLVAKPGKVRVSVGAEVPAALPVVPSPSAAPTLAVPVGTESAPPPKIAMRRGTSRDRLRGIPLRSELHNTTGMLVDDGGNVIHGAALNSRRD